MRRLATFVAISVVGASLPSGGVGSTDPIFGYWETANRQAIVEIGPCGERACGRMVWVSAPLDEDGRPRRDVTGRKLCGLALVTGLEREDVGLWGAGEIYNPRDGQVYSARVEAIAGDRIEVRGYAGMPLLGRSQVWTRAAGDGGGC